jgi:hypothetical protein
MASAFADNNRVAWTYTDGRGAGTDFRVSAKAVYVLGVDTAEYGGEAAAGTVRAIPKQLKMRKAKCTSAGHPAIWVTVYKTDAALWTTPGTSITRNLNGTDTVYVSTGDKREETNRAGITQSA